MEVLQTRILFSSNKKVQELISTIQEKKKP
jgi:hypothetical protein